MKNNFGVSCVAGAGLLLASHVTAQDKVSASDEEEIFELSPFEVDASKDSGYRANSTLAGSRLNTQLKDVAASVSVLTNEFMDDLGATGLEQALSYVAGAETGQDFEGDTTSGWVGGNQQTQPSRNRMRGLGRADTTADFFSTSNGHIDRYNIDRIAVVRGPNSILFGLGSPSGIINYAMKKGSVSETFGEFKIILDDFGTTRGEIDYNSVLVEDKLALRFMTLYDDERYQYKSAYDRDKRSTLTLKYKPTEKTTIDLSYEQLEIESRRPRYIAPEDQISAWAAAGSPTFDTSSLIGGVPGADPNKPFTQELGIVSADNGLFFTDMTTPIRDLEDPNSFYAIRLKNRNTDSITPSGDEITVMLRSSDPNDSVTFFTPPGVQDARVFPYQDVDLSALPGNWQTRDGNMKKIIMTHAFTDDLNIEVGYMQDQLIFEDYGQISSRTSGIAVDINEKLQDGSNNPNFMRPFIAGRGTGRFTDQEKKTLRAQLSYELDLVGKSDRNWLGLHRFGALYSESSSDKFTFSYEPRLDGLNHPAFTPRDSDPTNLESPFRRSMAIYYVGDPMTPGQAYPNFTGFPEVDLFGNGDSIYLRYYDKNVYDTGTETWVGGLDADGNLSGLVSGDNNEIPLSHTDVVNSGSYSNLDIESMSATMQSFFLEGKVVTTLGYRDDKVSEVGVTSENARMESTGNVSLDRELWGIADANVAEISESTVSKGIVVHPLKWLSAHYNESENFVVSAPKTNILGERIPGSSGAGKDYGFSLRLLEDKLNVKVNWFETAQQNSRNGSLDFVSVWRIPGFEMGLWSRVQNNAGFVDENGDRFVFTDYDGTTDRPTRSFGSADVNDYTAEGMEIEATYNPNKNWRFSMNVSKAETIQSNTGVAIEKYVAAREEEWSKYWDLDWSSTRTVRDQYNAAVGGPLFPALSSNGRVAQNQSKWSANFVSNYRFTDGRFKGVNIGASARWRDSRSIGYGTKFVDNVQVTDIDNAFYADPTTNVGVHASYGRPIFDDSVDWKIQLNIQNLVGDEELIPIRVNPTGVDAAFRVGRERKFQLTNSFKF